MVLMWTTLLLQLSAPSEIIPAAVPPSPGNSRSMTDLFGGYKVLVVLTYLGTVMKS